jgi:Ca2+-binding RTX toxin-like protein
MAIIIGTTQSETLIGTPDNDTIIGRSGHDVLTGGDGGDRFVYQRLSDLSAWTGTVLPWRETITDLGELGNVIEPDERDVLDFSALDDFLFIGDDEFSATGRNEYRFQSFGEFGLLVLFDDGGDGTTDRYLVIDDRTGHGSFDEPDEHPIFTNLLDPHDFDYHYEVGTAANETIAGTDADDRLYGLGGNDTIDGDEGDDQLFGGAGNDRLDGGAGIDTLIGGAGDDVYYVQTSEFEDVFEKAGEGIDHIIASGGFYNPLPANVENLTMLGDAFQGEGNDLANVIAGNSVTNRLGGGAGNDAISGHGGADSIRGGTGNDWIRGGTGADYIIGGSGNDKFVFYSVAEIGFAGDGTGDFLRDFAGFNTGGGDRIDLHRIDADVSSTTDDAFRFIGSAEFSGTAGELRDVTGTVNVVDPDPIYPDEPFEAAARLIEGDVDGDGIADFRLAVVHDDAIPLSARDFYL